MPDNKNIKYASNGMTSSELFEGRKKYFEKNQDKQFIDVWYDKKLYGKINSQGNSIYPSETNLKQLRVEGKTLFVLDFVADAYEEMTNFISKLIASRRIKSDSFITKLKPEKSWSSINLFHHEQMETIYKAFILLYLKEGMREQKITSFDEFLKYFLIYTKSTLARVSPITRTAFIKSQYCTPLISGLMIELQEFDHSNDMIKEEEFIENDGFPLYKDITRRFGFMIDKNAPWRLVADISSPAMQKHMSKYGISTKVGSSSDLFDIYFYHASDVDIEILRKYLISFYNSYVTSYPTTTKVEIKNNSSKNKKIVQREVVDENNLSKKLDDNFWLSYYFKIRMYEEQKYINEDLLNSKIKRALELQKSLDKNSAMIYIERETKK